MKVLLFDYVTSGHHELYLRRFVEVLGAEARVTVAAPPDSEEVASELGVSFFSLGRGKRPVDTARPLSATTRAAGREEVSVLRAAIHAVQPDRAIHLFADSVLRWLALGRLFPAPLSLLLFRPRAHYPSAYGTPLTPKDRAQSQVYEWLLQIWRRRSDAGAILTLDEGAAERWAHRGGSPALWLPEPPPRGGSNLPEVERRGCLVFGSIAPRKGVDLLAKAVSLRSSEIRVTLAGAVRPEYRGELRHWASLMRSRGASVEVRDRWHSEEEVLALLRSAECVVMPYVGHYGMSRVLLEAAVAGTPVIVHDHGLLSHLVRRHGLGLAVDCTNPNSLRGAVEAMTEDRRFEATRQHALEAFAARYSQEAFTAAVKSAVGLGNAGAQALIPGGAAVLDGTDGL